MQIGTFQLLSQPSGISDREVIEQALWEVDTMERLGFDTVWVTEHHFSEYGMIGVPSVYGAMVAQRTKRLRIAYGIAVAALHHPLRLAEEIAWVDQLSRGRIWVGIGPGFSPFEFEAFGQSLDERYDRMWETIEILQGVLGNDEYEHQGRFWQFPKIRLKPRPYTLPHPPLMLASSSEESLVVAAQRGMPALIGFRPNEEVGKRLERYREIRQEQGIPAARIAREIAQIGVLRRVHVAESDEEAREDVIGPLVWYQATSQRVHRRTGTETRDPNTGQKVNAPQAGSLPDGSAITTAPDPEAVIRQSEGGMIAGTPDTVLRKLQELEDLGIGHVIAWMNFGNMPYAKVRRSMKLLGTEVLPRLRSRQSLAARP